MSSSDTDCSSTLNTMHVAHIRCVTPGGAWHGSLVPESTRDMTVPEIESLMHRFESDHADEITSYTFWLGYQLPLVDFDNGDAESSDVDPTAKINEWILAATLFLKLKSLAPENCKLIHLGTCMPSANTHAPKRVALDPLLATILGSSPLLRRRYSDLAVQTNSGTEEAKQDLAMLDLYTDEHRSSCWDSFKQARHNESLIKHFQADLETAKLDLAKATELLKRQQEEIMLSARKQRILEEKALLEQRESQQHKSAINDLNAKLTDLKADYIRVRDKSIAMREEINGMEVRNEADLDKLFATQIELEEVFSAKKSIQNLCSAQSDAIRRAQDMMQKLAQVKQLHLSGAQPSVQMLALLEGYRHSLKRAERLLLGGS
jgi:hypothetical protein